MSDKQYVRLSQEQQNQIRRYLLQKPMNLSPGLSVAEFPREFDIYVYEADTGSPVRTYYSEIIDSGRFFRIVQFSQKVFAALYFDHDRYGIFGTPKTVESFSLSDMKLSKTQYEECLSDLATVVHSIDPNVQIEWDGREFMAASPVVVTGLLHE